MRDALGRPVNDPFASVRHARRVDGSRLGADEPLYAFCHNGDPDYARLRGAAAFRMWKAIGRRVEIDATMLATRPARYLIAAPVNPALVDDLERMRDWTDTCIAVDVAFPLLWMASAQTSDEGMAFWTDPANREQALRAIRAADVVTTPRAHWFAYPEWIDELAEYNPNVVVLPDLMDPDSDDAVAGFARALDAAWRSGIRAKLARLAARR